MYYRTPIAVPNMDISVIFADIVANTALEYGNNINYQFGDWGYISKNLIEWSSSKTLAPKRYPVICLFSPSDESKKLIKGKTEIYLNFLIAVSTMPDYSNEKRREVSFDNVLKPIYKLFIQQIAKDKRIDVGYNPTIPHSYTENYRYGRIGVDSVDGKPFVDKIDAIDIRKLKITLKKQSYGL